MDKVNHWKSPAKINLYLAVVGVREDGFHELDSLVGILDFGDDLSVEKIDDDCDRFECNVTSLSYDDSNLICKALELYRKKTGYVQRVKIRLEKRIPMGAGLGGGSSNASTILKAIDFLNPESVGDDALREWSADLGSDCPLFFSNGLIRIRGRGEIVESFKSRCFEESRGGRIVLFHPGFGIGAGWAYTTLRNEFPSKYGERTIVDREIAAWAQEDKPWLTSHRNDLSIPVDSKYVAIPVLKNEFKKEFGRPLFMSGSGSSCFAFLEENPNCFIDFVKDRWGEGCFVEVCKFK